MNMMSNLTQIIHDDVYALFSRALIGKQVYAFGEDGFGQYGKHPFAQYYTIKNVNVYLGADPVLGKFRTTVTILLDGYDSSTFGHIYTDKNFGCR